MFCKTMKNYFNLMEILANYLLNWAQKVHNYVLH